MKLMVVEDSSSMRKVLRTMLRNLGYGDVHEAEDGSNAWEQLKGGGFDLLISDWNMPNVSGLELLEKVRSNSTTAALPVIMATSRTERDDVIAAMKAGANNYISKPFNPTQLKDKIDKVLQSAVAKQPNVHANRLGQVLVNSASLEASLGAALPLVIFVEKTTDLAVLNQPNNQDVARSLCLKIDAFDKVNREHAGDRMAYMIEENGQNVMKILRKVRDHVQFICIHSERSADGATLARLVLTNHKVGYKVVLIVQSMFEFSVTQRSNMRVQGIILMEKKSLTVANLERLFVAHCPLIVGRSKGGEEEESSEVNSGEPQGLEEAMGRSEDLPVLPLFFSRVLRLACAPKSATADWVEAVEMDARCEHMLIARAQAASAGARKVDGDLSRATVLLGKEQVRDIAASVALYAPLESSFGDKAIAEGFWRHSIATGIIARMLTTPFDGRKLSPYEQLFFDQWRPEGQVVSLLKQFNMSNRFELADDELPFIGGLMHDIGQLAMASTYPKLFRETLESLASQSYRNSFLSVEHAISPGANHAQAGALLATTWRLDPALVRPIAGHHSPESDDHYALLIALSNCIAGAVESFPQEAEYPHALIVESLAGAMNPVVDLDSDDRDVLMEKFIPVSALEHVQMNIEKLIGLTAILAPSIKRMSNGLMRSMASAAAKPSSE